VHRLAILPLLAAAFASLAPGAAAQTPPVRGETIRLAEARRSADDRLEVAAVAAEGAVRIDGVLDEEVWARAVPVGGFVQAEPREGQPASERTEVRVAFDRENLYIAAYLYDSDPAGAVVNDLRKDFSPDDQDTFEVLLDTFADRRNGYVFIVNPVGARSDRQVANEGREINTSWDAVWTVRTQRTADGWTAEMAIPFRALRFDPQSGGTWGVNFSRRIRRKNEITFWSPVPRAYNLNRVSLAGNLTGLPTTRPGRDLRVKPYALGRTLRETGGASFGRDMEFGGDLKFGLTSGLTLDATANPDFAQVEADEQQVNLSQFSQFFPEKREFFLENSGIFYVGDAARNNRVRLTPTPDEDLLLFFSRRIGLTRDGREIPILGGVRLTGQAAGVTLGAMTVQTQEAYGAASNNYTVLRARRNLFGGSDVGAILMSRQAMEGADDYNRVYGVDANLRFFGGLDWNSYLIRTEAPGVSEGNYAARSSLKWEGNLFHAKGGLMQIGEGFRNDLGYYRRTASRKWFVESGIRPRFRSLQGLGIREMHPHVVWNYYEDLDGKMIGKRLHTGYSFFFNSGGYTELSVNPEFQKIDRPLRISRDVDPIPAGGYGWNEWQLRGSSDPSRALSVGGNAVVGGLWSGTQRTVNGTLSLRPSYRLRTTVGVQRTAAELEQPQASFVTTLWTMRANYSFTTNMFLDGLMQYDPKQELVNANLRFNLIHRPLSDLYVVLNEQRFFNPLEPTPPGRSLILKYTQMFAF
jgi:hypothetical protein